MNWNGKGTLMVVIIRVVSLTGSIIIIYWEANRQSKEMKTRKRNKKEERKGENSNCWLTDENLNTHLVLTVIPFVLID